jgi:hypothetical protein
MLTLFKQIIDVNRNLRVCFWTVIEEDLEEFACLCESRLVSANLSFPYPYTNHLPTSTYLATTLYASYLSTYLPTYLQDLSFTGLVRKVETQYGYNLLPMPLVYPSYKLVIWLAVNLKCLCWSEALEIIFEVQTKRSNEKITRKNKLFNLQNTFFSIFFSLTFKPHNFFIFFHFKWFKVL